MFINKTIVANKSNLHSTRNIRHLQYKRRKLNLSIWPTFVSNKSDTSTLIDMEIVCIINFRITLDTFVVTVKFFQFYFS